MQRSFILKLALFATGLSGIVAEYILATLATYFLGNGVLQWTMIVSVMMFSMGLGSRFSRSLHKQLLQKFVFIEFILSVLVASSALIAYSVAAFSAYIGVVIYSLSIFIGILIGMEIPLAVRLNDEFESLRINVASIIEKDYYGSLVGGAMYAFVGLPYLGLTYMPIALGLVNFLVAIFLLIILWENMNFVERFRIKIFTPVVVLILASAFIFAEPIIFFGEQNKYKDKIVFSHQSLYQKITITQWKNHYWLYINGNQQLSTRDEVMYHEPIVHPIVQLHRNPKHVLVLGGGDGCVVRELLKYNHIEKITLVDLDPAMTELAKNNSILTVLNKNSLHNKKVEVINQDGFTYLEDTQYYFDIIIIDLPDPKTVDLARLYSQEFYTLCKHQLRPHGLIITQAGSPYYATRAFLCIEKTIKSSGFSTALLHNQIVTMGEWGWIIASTDSVPRKKFVGKLRSLSFENVETKWINTEAMLMMTSFGKNIYINTGSGKNNEIEINTIINPVLQRYYLKGNWDLY